MSFNGVTIEHICSVYKLLKTYAYFENLNLFLKERVATFEKSYITDIVNSKDITNSKKLKYNLKKFTKDIKNKADHPFNKIANVLNSKSPLKHPDFKAWLEDIDFRLYFKGFENEGENSKKTGTFLTNRKTKNEYIVNKVNYFIDAPIELHILEILWTVLVGKKLDDTFRSSCFGNRLSEHTKRYPDSFYKGSINPKNFQGELFKRYVEQYKDWRDGALKTASSIVEESDSNLAIFSLDIKLTCSPKLLPGVVRDFRKIESKEISNETQTIYRRTNSQNPARTGSRRHYAC